ncbi:MAG: glycosyltransferase family 39 protein [Candidatus Nanohaloarchaea archaeon]
MDKERISFRSIARAYRFGDWMPVVGIVLLGWASRPTSLVTLGEGIVTALLLLSYSFISNDYFDSKAGEESWIGEINIGSAATTLMILLPLSMVAALLPFLSGFQIAAVIAFVAINILYSAPPFRLTEKPFLSLLMNSMGGPVLLFLGLSDEVLPRSLIFLFLAYAWFFLISELLHQFDDREQDVEASVPTIVTRWNPARIRGLLLKGLSGASLAGVLAAFNYTDIAPLLLGFSLFNALRLLNLKDVPVGELGGYRSRVFGKTEGVFYLSTLIFGGWVGTAVLVLSLASIFLWRNPRIEDGVERIMEELKEIYRRLEGWMDRRRAVIILLAAALVMGIAARFYALGSRPFWEDEAMWSLVSKQLAESARLIPKYPTSKDLVTGHPPVFFHLNSLVYRIVRVPTEASLRFLSALSGSLTVLIAFLLGKEFYGEEVGLIAAFLLAISSNHILYSRQVHPASLGVLFLGISVYLGVKSARSGSSKYLAATLASSLLAVSTHFMNFVLVMFFPLLFLVEDGWREGFRSIAGSAAAYIALFTSTVAWAVWSVDNAVPPKKKNPFYHELDLSRGVFDFLSRLVKLPFVLVNDYLLQVDYGRFVDGMWSLLNFYVNPALLYLPGLLSLVPLLDLEGAGIEGKSISMDEEGRSTLISYLWFLSTFLLLGVPVMAVYAVNNLRPIRGHPFLILPVILLAARGSYILVKKHRILSVIPLLLLLTYLTHLPAVSAGKVVNEQLGESMERSINDTRESFDLYVDADFQRGKLWFDMEYEVYWPKVFTDTTSIVCTEEEFRPLFCFNRHPVGFNDALDWRESMDHLESRIETGEPVYASVAAPVIYYTNMSNPVTGLSCNVEHRFCNMTRILKEEKPLWVVTDKRRFRWQFTSWEKNYLRENCSFTKVEWVHLYHCRGS